MPLFGAPYGFLGIHILSAPPLINDYISALPNLELYYTLGEPDNRFTTTVDYSGNHRDGAIAGSPRFNTPYTISANGMEFTAGSSVTSVNTPINITDGRVSVFYRAVDHQSPPAGHPGLIFGLAQSGKQDKVICVNTDGSITFKVWDTTTFSWAGVTAPASGVRLDRWMLIVGEFISGTVSLTINDPTDAYYFHGSAVYGGTTRADFTVGNAHVAGGWNGPDAFVGMPGYYDELFVQKVIVADPAPQSPPTWGLGQGEILNSPLLISAVSGEVVYDPNTTPALQTTQVVGEVLRDSGVTVRRLVMTQFVMEVLRSAEVGEVYPTEQTLVFTQTAAETVIRPKTAAISQSLAFTQSARRNRSGPASQTLAFTQTATLVVSKAVGQSLTFTQTAVAHFVRNRSILQILLLSQSHGESHAANVGVNQTLAFTPAARLGHLLAKDVGQVLVAADTASAHVVHTQSPSQTLAFTQTDAGGVGIGAAAGNTLAFVQIVSYRQTHVQSVAQTLEFRGAATPGPITRSRSVSKLLSFHDGQYPAVLPITVGGRQVVVTLPVGRIIRVLPVVIVRSTSQTIVLPSAEFGDGEGTANSVSVKRTMTGRYFTYVKTSKARTLGYTFVVSRRKCSELRDFVRKNLSTVITLTNWKGEVYVGQITSNPESLDTDGRYANAYERVTVSFEFEGVRT